MSNLSTNPKTARIRARRARRNEARRLAQQEAAGLPLRSGQVVHLDEVDLSERRTNRDELSRIVSRAWRRIGAHCDLFGFKPFRNAKNKRVN